MVIYRYSDFYNLSIMVVEDDWGDVGLNEWGAQGAAVFEPTKIMINLMC